MGVVFFIFNAAFALILLLMVLVSSIYALASKNPDTRYQPMRDDRGSFIKSQTQLTTELDALGATARGEPKPGQNMAGYYGQNGSKGSRIEDDDDSFSDNSLERAKAGEAGMSPPNHTAYNPAPPRSPADPSAPFMAGTGHPAPSYYSGRSQTSSPSLYSNAGYPRQQPPQFRGANNASPWQRGAGYEH